MLDPSVALKWALAEPDAAKARQLRDDFRNAVHELIAPDSFTLEIAHASTKALRRGMIPVAWNLWADVITTVPHLFLAYPLTPRAVQIVSQSRIGDHDGLYVALAEREVCERVCHRRCPADQRPQAELYLHPRAGVGPMTLATCCAVACPYDRDDFRRLAARPLDRESPPTRSRFELVVHRSHMEEG